MPAFPIIDAHVHLWDPKRTRIPWLDGDATLDKPYGLAEYRAQTQGIAVEGIVFMEVDVAPSYRLLEAQRIAELASKETLIRAIVPSAPLEDGERVRSFLEALQALSPRIKGVRRLLQDEPDVNYALRPDFVRGVQLLPEYSFSFDICIRHYQLPGVVSLVQQCPATAFILDHIAKPDIKNHVLDPWRQQMRALAALPNVLCKVSGVVTEADHRHWTRDELSLYILHVLDIFGVDRVVFGSDWPVVLHAASYTRWVEALEELTAHLTPEDQRKLWADNARRFYRLNEK
jgi:L-fuconolactonase